MRAETFIRLVLGAAVVPFGVRPVAAEDLLRIAAADCARLTRHTPAPDVAYRPGVDVRGKAVTSADLDGGAQLNLPAEIVVAIEVDLAKRYGLPRRPGVYDGTAVIGTVTVKDGQALFNGQPMHAFDQALVAEACRARAPR